MTDVEGPPGPEHAFVPVGVRSAAAQAADQIVEAIRSGHVGQHQSLPAERELAKQLGVSRPTLREALAALELAEVVETRQGRGTMVVATRSQVANWGIQVHPTQVFEARLAIEPHLAELLSKGVDGLIVAPSQKGERGHLEDVLRRGRPLLPDV